MNEPSGNALTWQVMELMNHDIHIVPDNDTMYHLLEAHCPCNPLVKDGITTHNADDERELIEELFKTTTPKETDQ